MVKIKGLILWGLGSSVAAAPGVSFHINSQVPPVARVLKPFSFAFPATTFSSSSPPLVYSIAEAPAWLQLDSSSRTFSGTPGVGDVGAKEFQLVATDGSGSSTLPVTFIISADPGPGLGVPLSEQLSAFGTLSASQSLVLYPAKPLSISFGPDTFTNTNDQTNYYASCANNTPLPSWINFNPKALSFSGSTPSFTSPAELPQDFGIELTASDVAGFSGAVTTFHIIITNHILSFDSETINAEFSPGQPWSSNVLQNHLDLDGEPIQSSDIKSIQAATPDWLTIDPQTLHMSGSPPLSTAPFQLNISVIDIYEDTASALVIASANSSTALISGRLGAASVTAGTALTYVFDRALFPVSGTEVTLDLGAAVSWLSFDSSSLTLHGNAPADLNAQQIALDLTASHASQSQKQTFQLTILERRASSGNSAIPLQTVDTTSAASSSLVTALPTIQPKVPKDAQAGAQGKEIAAAIVVPLVALLGVGLLGFWCYRRKGQARRRRRQRTSSQSSVAAWKKIISRPFFAEEQLPEVIRERTIVHHKRVPSQAPILPELHGMRGTFRNSTQPPLGKSKHEEKRVSKRESRLNISHGLSLRQSVTLFTRGGRHEGPADFAMAEEEAGRSKGPGILRGRSGSNTFNKEPNGIGHGKAPMNPVPNFSINTRSSRLSRHGTQLRNGLGHGKGIPSPFGTLAGRGGIGQTLHNASSEGSYAADGSSNLGSGPALKDFPRPPESTVKLVPSSPTYSRSSRAYPRILFPSGPSTNEKSGWGTRLASNLQSSSESSSAIQSEGGGSSGQGPSTSGPPNRSRPTSSWYSHKTCSTHSLDEPEVPPMPPFTETKFKSSTSTRFLQKYLPGPLRPKSSKLTIGSESDFANPVESEDENGGGLIDSAPGNVLAVPTHTIFQGRSMDHLPDHPGPLTAHGVSTIRTWRSSRNMHQTMSGTHSASGSSGQSSTSSAASDGHGETHQVGVGEVARKVSVESSIHRNRPGSRSLRAEPEGGAFL